MEIKTNISKEFKDTTIIVNATKMTQEVQNVIKYISNKITTLL